MTPPAILRIFPRQMLFPSAKFLAFFAVVFPGAGFWPCAVAAVNGARKANSMRSAGSRIGSQYSGTSSTPPAEGLHGNLAPHSPPSATVI